MSSMFSKVPWTRTTGYGWAALGLQLQLFAPGGGVVGVSAVAVAPGEEVVVDRELGRRLGRLASDVAASRAPAATITPRRGQQAGRVA